MNMEPKDDSGNPGQRQNQEESGIPLRQRKEKDENLDKDQESLPSDGPVSQSEGTAAPDLDKNLERDNPSALREDANPD